MGHAFQESGFFDLALEDCPDEIATIRGVYGDGFKGGFPGCFEFIEIGYIVYERECARFMDEAKLWDEPHGAGNGGGEGVEGGVGGGEGSIDPVGEIPIGRFVVAAFPHHAVFLAEVSIGFADAYSLHPSKLGDGNSMRISFGEALEKHTAGNFGFLAWCAPCGGVNPGHRVIVVRRDPKGVEAHAFFSHPEDGAV